MNQNLLKQYVSIVQKVAKIEQRRVPNHMVEYEELVSIGIIAVQAMIKNKTEEQLAKYNDAYMGTAVKWAIRNELRHRYKWYSLKHKKDKENGKLSLTMKKPKKLASENIDYVPVFK